MGASAVRRAARVDANQIAIVDALRACGVSVWVTSSLGNGAPDIVAGHHGRNVLLEIKDGGKSASRTRLTEDEERFALAWRGLIVTVHSVEEALRAVLEDR